MKKVRFTAEWITRQSPTDAADCDYDGSDHETFEAAKLAAMSISETLDVTEWWAVSEEHYSRRYGWETVNRWTGDWEGNIVSHHSDEAA